jgi:hypothetical protein
MDGILNGKMSNAARPKDQHVVSFFDLQNKSGRKKMGSTKITEPWLRPEQRDRQ